MTDWYCSYCDKLVGDNEVGGGAKHKDCGWRMWPMLPAVPSRTRPTPAQEKE